MSQALLPRQLAVRPASVDRVIPTTEVIRLQDELLQLSVVYEKSAATLQEYERSIRSQLRTKFEDVGKQFSALTSVQCDRQVRANAHAVSQWLENERRSEGVALAGSETLLVLAHCLGDLQQVSKENGPLDVALKIFDEWCIYASSRRSTRNADDFLNGVNGDEEGCFIRPIHAVAPQWSALVSSVQDGVTACAASLGELQRPPESSSIGLLIKMHSTLAEQILQEIKGCRSIEELIVREEREWIETAVEAALQDLELRHTVNASSAGVRRGIWEAREVL